MGISCIPHVDSNAIEPGLLQHLIFLHPPPSAAEVMAASDLMVADYVRMGRRPRRRHPALAAVDYFRMGVFCAWYPPNPHLWRAMVTSALLAWRLTPDFILRDNGGPKPNLGSGPSKKWKCILPDARGGGTPTELANLSDHLFLAEVTPRIAKLPEWLRDSIPAPPAEFGIISEPAPAGDGDGDKPATSQPLAATSAEDIAKEYCTFYSLPTVTEETLQMHYDKAGEKLRELLIQAIAGGTNVGRRNTREYFSGSALQTAPLVLIRARLFGDLPKVRRWCEAGGRHKRQPAQKTENRWKDDAKIRAQSRALRSKVEAAARGRLPAVASKTKKNALKIKGRSSPPLRRGDASKMKGRSVHPSRRGAASNTRKR